MSRLTIDVTEQQHQTLKAMAALQGKTIKQYALERLFPSNAPEDTSMAELRSLLVQRMGESREGDVLDRSFTDIADEVIRGGGKA